MRQRPTNYNLLTIFALALFLRLIFVFHPGFLADIAYWKWWTRDSAQNGLVHTITQTGINYPPLYLLVMKATGHVYSFFGDLNNESVFWDRANGLFLLLIKLPLIAADLVIGYLIYRFVRDSLSNLSHLSNLRGLPLLAASLWLFNPGVIYDSALWGQTDSLGVVPVLLAYILAVSGNPFFAGALAGVAFFLKAQSIPLILFLFLYLLLRYGAPRTIRAAAAATAVGLAVNAPYLITHSMDRVIGTILTSVGYFPWASLYAFNLWWWVIKGVSFQFPDQTLLWGLWTYRTVGFTLFWSAFAVLSLVLWRSFSSKEPNDPGGLSRDSPKNDSHKGPQFWVTPSLATPGRVGILFLCASLLILSAFLLPTEIHERYLLPFFAFFPIAIALALNNLRYLGYLSFFFFSLSWLLNLHFVMIKNYPENELPLLSLFSPHLQSWGVWFSVLNLALYLGLFFLLMKLHGLTPVVSSPQLRRERNPSEAEIRIHPRDDVRGVLRRGIKRVLTGRGILVAGLLPIVLLSTLGAFSIVPRSLATVSLTSLKPSMAVQSWGQLAVNKSVGGNNLSVYYFYGWTGLGTHANSQIEYEVNGGYKKMESDVGVDTMGANEAATVEFQIYGDGKLLARSGVMKKWEYPKHLSADLLGVKKLTLVVSDAGDGINGDHADWMYPTLYK